MKILALIHGYPQHHNAGAEWMLHEMLKFLAPRHDIEVLLPITDMQPYEFEGIKVGVDSWQYTRDVIKEKDLIITHLNRSGWALNACEFFKKPMVQVIHNTNNYGIIRVKAVHGFINVIYNSLYTRDTMNYPVPGIVVHPPVDVARYKVPLKGERITLINLFERKGGKFFNELIKLMPDYEFLGAEGMYGDQEKCSLPNVKYMENTPNARLIYSQTRILLMPSIYESYGRTAVEAMCSGIPVIANPTPGLKESLGDAGIFCKIESPLSWIDAIKKLDDPKEYKKASDKCLRRSKEIDRDTPKELKAMEEFFETIVNKPKIKEDKPIKKIKK